MHAPWVVAFAFQVLNTQKIAIAPGMAEACKVVSLGAPLCDEEEACVGRGDDHSEAVCICISGASSGSLCSSASDMSDDATSSPPDHSSVPSSASSSTLQLDSEGSLYELSSLLAQLPVRRGLSKYYQGKSHSFTSISDATCVQDLAKQITYNKRMKTCKSYAAGLDMNQRPNHLPRSRNKMIAKRPTKGSFACLLSRASNTSLLYSSGKLPAHQNKKDVQMHMNT